MYIVGQSLTPGSKSQVLGKAIAYGDEWLGNEISREEGERDSGPPHWESGSPNYRTRLGL